MMSSASSFTSGLQHQIDSGRIIFDSSATTTDRLKQELLGQNPGTHETETLQKLVLELSRIIDDGQMLRISSIIRNEGHHPTGRAVDFGNEVIAEHLPSVKQAATNPKVESLGFDEIIVDAVVRRWCSAIAGTITPGTGISTTTTLDDYGNHIRFAVEP